ncbi:hypothetical protein HNY73_011209 [Argiope bruennichi]|uniref:Uncharacterized protein n=1 Tax=Argiope bruennichi TaxID=94029 RepID=A0A8T0F3D5_ARGBR|nr:hypothetical protein HNY73_011209 [Argiope bruennichi]
MADVDRLIRRHRQHNYMVRTAKFAVGVFDLTRYTPPYIELVLEHMRQIQRGALAIRFLTKRLVRCCFRSQTQEHRKDFIIEDRRYTFVFIDIAESTYLQRIEGERLLYEIDGFIVIISLVDTETTHLVQVLLDRLYYETYWIERFPPQACDDLNSRARFDERNSLRIRSTATMGHFQVV